MRNAGNQVSVQRLKELVTELAEIESLCYLGLFGSSARGEASETSDLDMVVTFKKTPSLFKLLELEDKLQRLTGKKVDLLTHDSINSLIKPRIEKDMITLYER